MSSEKNNVIRFPGSKKFKLRKDFQQNEGFQADYLNQARTKQVKSSKVLEEDTLHNVLYFSDQVQKKENKIRSPNHLLKKGPFQKENKKVWSSSEKVLDKSKPSNLIRRPDDFWSGGKKADSSSNSAQGGSGQGGASSKGGASSSASSAPSKRSYYSIAGVACALCFTLVTVPFLNQKNARGLASLSDSVLPIKITKQDGTQHRVNLYEDMNGKLNLDLVEHENSGDQGVDRNERDPDSVKNNSFLKVVKSVFSFSNRDPDNEDREKFKKILNRQQEKALRLISTGQRKLANIGQKPEIKDIFSIETLSARYNVRWKRGKLVYAILLPGKEPVLLPTTDQVVNKHKEIFPTHVMIRKLDSLSGDLEIYELRDDEGLIIAQVETLRDEGGRALSIHVQ